MRNAVLDLLSPVGAAGVSEAVVRQIGELIGSGEIRPGERLPSEAELADVFRVAPMTVRAAMQVLRDYGLIETRRGRSGGTFIRTDAVRAAYFQSAELPSLEEFEDFTVWRVAVTGEASARLAARFAATAVAPEEHARLLALTEASHERGHTTESFRFADAELHLYIAELCGSPRLLEAERSIQSQLTRTLRHMAQPPDTAVLSGQSHAALVSAIVEGRPEDARRELRTHVQSTVDLMVGVGFLPHA